MTPPRDPGFDSSVSDENLVAAAQQGDRAALSALLERHYDRVRATCVRIAGSTRDGDDAAQEAMIRIVNNLKGFDGRSSFKTWAYRIATNAAIDELRRRQRRDPVSTLDPSDAPELPDLTSGTEFDAFDLHQELSAALRELPEEFRAPIVLRDVADLDYDQISLTLNIPLGTVKSRIARGRRVLRETLGNQTDGSQRPTTHNTSSPHLLPADPHAQPDTEPQATVQFPDPLTNRDPES